MNAATCNATHTAGCAQPPGIVKVGQGTFVLAVSAATDTVYGQNAGTSSSGFTNGNTVSVINGATCNGTVYVTDETSAAVSVLHGARCDAAVTTGCGANSEQAIGSTPVDVTISTDTNTVYVTDIFQSGILSLLSAAG